MTPLAFMSDWMNGHRDSQRRAGRGQIGEVGGKPAIQPVVVHLRRDDGPYRGDGRGLVPRHASAEEAGNGNRRDDADDGHDDEQLDEGEALAVANAHVQVSQEGRVRAARLYVLTLPRAFGRRLRKKCRRSTGPASHLQNCKLLMMKQLPELARGRSSWGNLNTRKGRGGIFEQNRAFFVRSAVQDKGRPKAAPDPE